MSDLVPMFISGNISSSVDMRESVIRMQAELSKLPQYEPKTMHTFHGGMYCREVWRDAGVLVVGKVHRKEHFYLVISGTILVTTDDGVQRFTGPCLVKSSAGTKRAVFSETPALCMTFHRTDAKTVEDAEVELVEEEEKSMYDSGNLIKQQPIEVLK
jgi:hypothetical protein